MDIRSRTEQLDYLKEAQKEATLQRVIAAILELQSAREPISFYSVAERAQVARSTLYRRDDLKGLVIQARDKGPSESAEKFPSPSLSDQLALMQAKLDALHRENNLLLNELNRKDSQRNNSFSYELITLDWAA